MMSSRQCHECHAVGRVQGDDTFCGDCLRKLREADRDDTIIRKDAPQDPKTIPAGVPAWYPLSPIERGAPAKRKLEPTLREFVRWYKKQQAQAHFPDISTIRIQTIESFLQDWDDSSEGAVKPAIANYLAHKEEY